MGDFLIAYETEAYAAQTPVAFLNWATTDTLTHTNEPFEEEDRVSVNTEAILPTAQYYGGLFAAVDVYPYYPEFMNHQPEYLEPGETGEANPYRAYLAELRTQYSVPVLVAEFGVPSSRGMAHKSVMGFHQGGLTEEEQGEAIVRMMEAIAQEGYAGSLIFSWRTNGLSRRGTPSDTRRMTRRRALRTCSRPSRATACWLWSRGRKPSAWWTG